MSIVHCHFLKSDCTSCQRALDLPGTGSQIGLLGGLDERVRLSGAAAAEVVVVDGPEHDASQPVVAHVLRLQAQVGTRGEMVWKRCDKLK